MELPSIVLLEQLRTIDKRRLGDFIGHLTKKHIQGINHAMAVSVGLIESIPNKLILCLCRTCAGNFYGTSAYSLRRIDHLYTPEFHLKGCVRQRNFRRISLRITLNVPPMSLLKQIGKWKIC